MVLLKARLIGVLSLQDLQGRDCTPRGQKARALVGLLALSPDHRRPRRWIEAKLWSDRGAEQASGSLRQALVELRSALGPAADALVSDRETVGLTGLRTDIDEGPEVVLGAFDQGHDLLEGLDLRDPAFDRWLKEQRARLSGRAEPTELLGTDQPGLPFVIRPGMMPSGFGGFIALAMADAIGKLVSEFAAVDVYGPSGASVQLGSTERGLLLTIDASEGGDKLHVVAGIGSLRTGQVFWSRQARLPMQQNDLIAAGEFPGIVFEAAEAALAALPRIVGNDPSAFQVDALVSRAVREMFSFDTARLHLADRLLAQAAAVLPSPRVHAWHAFLKQLMMIERIGGNREVLFNEAMTHARLAMQGASANPLVLALVSQVQAMLAGDAEGSAALSRDAVNISPGNAFAHAALAGSLLRQGRPAEALVSARHGAKLAARSSFLHWWESLAALGALGIGDFPTAIRHFEAARSRAPMFRPPLRHLLFLYLDSGQADRAASVMADLRRIEPDFSLDRMRDDPGYPAGTLRSTRLIGLAFPTQAG